MSQGPRMFFLSRFMSTFIFFLVAAPVLASDIKLISMDAVPWAYFDQKNGRYAGIFPDLVKEIEKHSGHQIKITLSPYARINRELESGRQDCTILISENNRQKITHLGELVFNIPMGVISSKKFKLNEYSDLHKIKISVLRSLDITEQFTSDERIAKEYDTAYEMGLRKILHGRVDAVAGTIPTIKYLIRKNDMEGVMGEPFVLGSKPIFLQCSILSKKSDYIKDVNFAIKEMRENGVVDSIVNKYYW